MRQMFRRDFGDAGTGFALAVRPWKWYSPVGGSIAASAGWRTDGVSQSSNGRLGLAGLCASADRAEEWVKITAQGRYFDIYLLKQPGGGTIDVWLDGALIHQGARLASAHYEPAYLEIGAERDGAHTIEIKISASGHVRLFGIAAESDAAGVIYDALGINGARAYLPLAWDWDVMTNNLFRRNPSLIILAYGSNEAGDSDFDASQYAKRFAEMLARFQQSAPDASILVISPPDRAEKTGKRWHSIKRLTAIVDAQRRAARAQGAAFWNLFEAMGGRGSIDRWAGLGLAQSDRVHLTRAGYGMVAEVLYAQLMRGYLQSLVGQAAAKLQSGNGRWEMGDRDRIKVCTFAPHPTHHSLLITHHF
jgi:lysophospholipase L1-like esterase